MSTHINASSADTERSGQLPINVMLRTANNCAESTIHASHLVALQMRQTDLPLTICIVTIHVSKN